MNYIIIHIKKLVQKICPLWWYNASVPIYNIVESPPVFLPLGASIYCT